MSEPKDAADGFLSRWSKRKTLVREGVVPAPEDVPSPARQAESTPAAPTPVRAELVEAPAGSGPSTSSGRTEDVSARVAPPPTLDDVAQLQLSSDFRRFVAPDVTPEVKNAAMKKLFSDPHFNVMDGLDTYIDDYGKPDPIPMSMLRQMVQSQVLGLFADEDEKDAAGAPAARATPDGAAAPEPAQSASEVPAALAADDQDPALRLQPLDAAGPPCDPGRAEQDAGRER